MINGLLTGLIFIGLFQYSACEFNETADCEGETFRCFDGSACLPSSFYCDGKSHCADDSDEYSCKNETCTQSEFRCHDGPCAPQHWRCDGVPDCKDGSDEIHCTEAEMCSHGYWKCSIGRCIPHYWRCDQERDCEDGSDEIGCHVACKEDHFQCTSGVCIPFSWRCDSHPDCSDASDEKHCQNNTTVELPEMKPKTENETSEPSKLDSNGSCQIDHFLCDQKRCIPKQWLCDGEVDCHDKADELNCYNGKETAIETDSPIAPSNTSEVSQNEFGEDPLLMSASEMTCQVDHFRCDVNKCIPNDWICDGGKDCMDQTDELNCNKTQESCRENEIPCTVSGTCIPVLWRCDGEFDCFDQTDEQDCVIVPSLIFDQENVTSANEPSEYTPLTTKTVTTDTGSLYFIMETSTTNGETSTMGIQSHNANETSVNDNNPTSTTFGLISMINETSLNNSNSVAVNNNSIEPNSLSTETFTNITDTATIAYATMPLNSTTSTETYATTQNNYETTVVNIDTSETDDIKRPDYETTSFSSTEQPLNTTYTAIVDNEDLPTITEISTTSSNIVIDSIESTSDNIELFTISNDSTTGSIDTMSTNYYISAIENTSDTNNILSENSFESVTINSDTVSIDNFSATSQAETLLGKTWTRDGISSINETTIISYNPTTLASNIDTMATSDYISTIENTSDTNNISENSSETVVINSDTVSIDNFSATSLAETLLEKTWTRDNISSFNETTIISSHNPTTLTSNIDTMSTSDYISTIENTLDTDNISENSFETVVINSDTVAIDNISAASQAETLLGKTLIREGISSINGTIIMSSTSPTKLTTDIDIKAVHLHANETDQIFNNDNEEDVIFNLSDNFNVTVILNPVDILNRSFMLENKTNDKATINIADIMDYRHNESILLDFLDILNYSVSGASPLLNTSLEKEIMFSLAADAEISKADTSLDQNNTTFLHQISPKFEDSKREFFLNKNVSTINNSTNNYSIPYVTKFIDISELDTNIPILLNSRDIYHSHNNTTMVLTDMPIWDIDNSTLLESTNVTANISDLSPNVDLNSTLIVDFFNTTILHMASNISNANLTNHTDDKTNFSSWRISTVPMTFNLYDSIANILKLLT